MEAEFSHWKQNFLRRIFYKGELGGYQIFFLLELC